MTTLSMAATSLSQDRFLFNQALNKEDWSYNIPMVMTLEGPLDGEGLEWSLNEIVRRHEVLRTGFSMNEEGEPVATVRSDVSLAPPLVDLSGLPEEEARAEAERLVKEDARRPFDLSDAPLMRILLVRVSETEHVFFCQCPPYCFRWVVWQHFGGSWANSIARARRHASRSLRICQSSTGTLHSGSATG